MFCGVVFARQTKFLEQLYQLVHKFFHFVHLKSIFSILHASFYKTPTSICLFYTFIQIKYSFLYPHNHRPTPTIHTGIHTTHRQKTRKTNPAKWIKTHTGIDASPWATRSTPPKASGGDGERHSTPFNLKTTRNKGRKSDRRRRRWRSTKARGRKIDQMRGRKKEHIFLLISCKVSTFFPFCIILHQLDIIALTCRVL